MQPWNNYTWLIFTLIFMALSYIIGCLSGYLVNYHKYRHIFKAVGMSASKLKNTSGIPKRNLVRLPSSIDEEQPYVESITYFYTEDSLNKASKEADYKLKEAVEELKQQQQIRDMIKSQYEVKDDDNGTNN